ncbi:cache domain-containing sensor histidine kinase [Vallitalea guaymasensis]|uniref:histidine kinase n=1 Tax=Vallitalea guaymasensis TaxID=1185412 RepID=A0A8J8MDF6_9FIRM|nr:sensor histidine kinase [Vallitalea guaymasensis]QUH30876.1 sensor histidine kinase [Vallitalea guaymasensis]
MVITKKYLEKIRYISIRTKILLSFSLVIISLISSTLIFALSKYNHKLLNNNIDYSKKVTSSLVVNLDEYIYQLKYISNIIAYNQYVQKYLNKHDSYYSIDSSDSFQRTLEFLSNIITSRSDIDSILIFDNDKLSVFKSTHLDLNTNYDYKNQLWYKNILESGVTPKISGPHKQEYLHTPEINVFSVNRTIQRYDGLKKTGVIHISVNLSELKKFCESEILYKNGFIFIVNDNGEIIYQPDNNITNSKKLTSLEKDVTNILPKLTNNKINIFTDTIYDEKYQIVSKYMSNANWYIVAATPYKSITEDAEHIKNIILSMGLLSLILALVITYILSTAITKPILNLRKCMAEATEGNLTIRSNIKSKDEIGILSSSFNGMLSQIEKLMQQVISDQEQKRKLELKTLQAQINPHFLYNTLDSIIWMAESKNDNIVPMTESLSKLFRISLSKGNDIIPLSSEIEHVRNYLFIQSMRYTDKFDYSVSVKPEVLRYKTIKLILQPIVENSIYHGIKNKRGKGNISINCCINDKKLLITITDDGIGMDSETCTRILSPSYKTDGRLSSGIGVHNVNERIKLYFGNQYGLRYESTISVGTTVYIDLPLIED